MHRPTAQTRPDIKKRCVSGKTVICGSYEEVFKAGTFASDFTRFNNRPTARMPRSDRSRNCLSINCEARNTPASVTSSWKTVQEAMLHPETLPNPFKVSCLPTLPHLRFPRIEPSPQRGSGSHLVFRTWTTSRHVTVLRALLF
jgi:hypothetical protein